MTDIENKSEETKEQTTPASKETTPDVSPQADTAKSLDTLKEQVADAYIGLMDSTKGGLFALGAELGVSLNPMKSFAKDYLLGQPLPKQGFREKLSTKFQERLMGQVNQKVEAVAYDQKELNAMKALIAKSGETELQNLLTMIQEGKDPIKEQMPTENTEQSKDSIQTKDVVPAVAAAGTGAVIETIDKSKRERVNKALDGILEEDEKNHIKYKRGSKDDEQGGLDCSGLIYHTIEDAGLQVPAGDSRSFFKQMKTQLVELNEDKSIKDNLGKITRGDLLFRNSTNPKYKRSAGEIPSITKDGKDYRIHHIAFVENINYADGTIDIVESNGKQGVTKSTISVDEWMTTKKKHQSELYVAHVNYNALPDALDQQKLIA